MLIQQENEEQMKRSNKVTVFLLVALACGSLSAYGLAQPKPMADKRAMSDAGTPPNSCMHNGMDCPMRSLAELADVKVEKTKTGATLQITAKDIAKLSEVQVLVEKMGEHMKAGGCPMMKGKNGPHHDHEHGEHGEHGKH
jgi:hypothetical protein